MTADVLLAKSAAEIMAARVEAYQKLMAAAYKANGDCNHPQVDFFNVCRFCAAVVPEADRRA
jgi:hypothetical protein